MAKKKGKKQGRARKGKGSVKTKKGAAIVYLGLGSNVGDREEYIEQAIFLLEKNPNIQVIRHSANYETQAEGGGSQPPYINAAVEIKTKLDPYKLLELIHEIEAALGRERELEWGPRTIDIDILIYDGVIISDDKLQIPHPLMHERLFVLKPMKDIAPSLMHPILEKTVEALYEARKAETGETYDDEIPGFKEIKGAGTDDYERW
ncbi:MAG: 2-amino-4-hydroxy-6-hydroxymethyldihydropteridine diphosphokinase [Candidatus Margulisbacteria bacterium]|nr:2-amino-4-hydroxy-6-hydroxymethyldihydropteridine diphosphokinase [Candidatus Margulisiibacteriota bacterium]